LPHALPHTFSLIRSVFKAENDKKTV